MFGHAVATSHFYHGALPGRRILDRNTFSRIDLRLRDRVTSSRQQSWKTESWMTSLNILEPWLWGTRCSFDVWNVFPEQLLYPYHPQLVEGPLPQDYSGRPEYCHWFLQQCAGNPFLLSFVLFTDEAEFSGEAIMNFDKQQCGQLLNHM
jgi:hypothetical protein